MEHGLCLNSLHLAYVCVCVSVCVCACGVCVCECMDYIRHHVWWVGVGDVLENGYGGVGVWGCIFRYINKKACDHLPTHLGRGELHTRRLPPRHTTRGGPSRRYPGKQEKMRVSPTPYCSPLRVL